MSRSEEMGAVTDFDACLNRLNEEINWLKENHLFVPLCDTPTNHISKLDAEFWLLPSPGGPMCLSSKWVKAKSQQLVVS